MDDMFNRIVDQALAEQEADDVAAHIVLIEGGRGGVAVGIDFGQQLQQQLLPNEGNNDELGELQRAHVDLAAAVEERRRAAARVRGLERARNERIQQAARQLLQQQQQQQQAGGGGVGGGQEAPPPLAQGGQAPPAPRPAGAQQPQVFVLNEGNLMADVANRFMGAAFPQPLPQGHGGVADDVAAAERFAAQRQAHLARVQALHQARLVRFQAQQQRQADGGVGVGGGQEAPPPLLQGGQGAGGQQPPFAAFNPANLLPAAFAQQRAPDAAQFAEARAAHRHRLEQARLVRMQNAAQQQQAGGGVGGVGGGQEAPPPLPQFPPGQHHVFIADNDDLMDFEEAAWMAGWQHADQMDRLRGALPGVHIHVENVAQEQQAAAGGDGREAPPLPPLGDQQAPPLPAQGGQQAPPPPRNRVRVIRRQFINGVEVPMAGGGAQADEWNDMMDLDEAADAGEWRRIVEADLDDALRRREDARRRVANARNEQMGDAAQQQQQQQPAAAAQDGAGAAAGGGQAPPPPPQGGQAGAAPPPPFAHLPPRARVLIRRRFMDGAEEEHEVPLVGGVGVGVGGANPAEGGGAAGGVAGVLRGEDLMGLLENVGRIVVGLGGEGGGGVGAGWGAGGGWGGGDGQRAVTEEMAAEAQKWRDEDESTPSTTVYSRLCVVCAIDNPHQRAVYTACGHIVCFACAVDNAKSAHTSGKCVTCRAVTGFVKLFEDKKSDFNEGQKSKIEANESKIEANDVTE